MIENNHNRQGWWISVLTLLLGLVAHVPGAMAEVAPPHLAAGRISDVVNTKHNFAASTEPELPPGETRTVKAQSENQTCVFCHTPHGKKDGAGFLWNRSLNVGPYTLYGSASLDATMGQPGIPSKMCLSCHDGTLAVSTLEVYTDTSVTPSRTDTDVTVAMAGLGDGDKMPAGAGVNTGYTRNLGTDLANDHPIGFTYDSALAQADGELVDPDAVSYLGPRVGAGLVQHNAALGGTPPANAPTSVATRLAAPLEPVQNAWAGTANYAELLTAGSMECTTCHDPHLRSSDNSINIKFLRLNRIQKAAPTGNFDKDQDINCLACHQKAGWPGSVHAHPTVADETYTSAETGLQELPEGIQVWETACSACHDAHTVPGAPRLLREGTDDTNSPKQGGNAASEETCYQCHGTGSVLQGTGLADIQTEFGKASAMPIDVNQSADPAQEVHQVVDADLTEPAARLGNGDGSERHVECTDCHHPHRMIRNTVFNEDPANPEASGTHDHGGGVHSNLASGVLRGIWGVEPIFVSDAFDPLTNVPTFEVKKGNPGVGASTDVGSTYLTREYQVCLKCHSAYANGQGKTDQALEFQAPAAHQGEPTADHRSWHPVIGPTRRDSASRGGADPNLWLAPWNATGALGNQTMYCSDCHGSDDPTSPAGPHGSNQGSSFGTGRGGLLTGPWTTATGGPSGGSQDFCFACHDYDQYANQAADPNNLKRSGFSCAADTCITAVADKPYYVNLHVYHAARNVGGAGSGTGARCMDCHTAMPHGWKNKALLVDLNAVGVEFGRPDAPAATLPYTEAPYYNEARLQVNTFRTSGNWDKASCGASGGCHN